MTEESYQECRKVMQKINCLRGLITNAIGEVRKWSNIESSFREKGEETRANGAKKMLDKALEKLDERKKKFSAMNFPDSNITKVATRCKECGTKTTSGIYCGGDMCVSELSTN